MILGISFAALTFLVKAPIGYFAGVASPWIQSRPIVIKIINRVSGVVLIGLGVKLAFEQR
jgi:threonine/homoserine/homoserine lactone efflux protein